MSLFSSESHYAAAHDISQPIQSLHSSSTMQQQQQSGTCRVAWCLKGDGAGPSSDGTGLLEGELRLSASTRELSRRQSWNEQPVLIEKNAVVAAVISLPSLTPIN